MASKRLIAVDHPELALTRNVEWMDVSTDLVVKQPSFHAAIVLCVQLSGLEEKEVYLSLSIDAGHWTRIMKGEAHFPTNKLNALCDLCGNEAPLQWWAHSRGYGLVVLKSEAERRAETAEKALREERDKVRWLTDMLQGRATT
jgi:hypothetical protein